MAPGQRDRHQHDSLPALESGIPREERQDEELAASNQPGAADARTPPLHEHPSRMARGSCWWLGWFHGERGRPSSSREQASGGQPSGQSRVTPLWRIALNWNGELHTFWRVASSALAAQAYAIRALAKVLQRDPVAVRRFFHYNPNACAIRREERKDVDIRTC